MELDVAPRSILKVDTLFILSVGRRVDKGRRVIVIHVKNPLKEGLVAWVARLRVWMKREIKFTITE